LAGAPGTGAQVTPPSVVRSSWPPGLAGPVAPAPPLALLLAELAELAAIA
jgi:hypothetical protein